MGSIGKVQPGTVHSAEQKTNEFYLSACLKSLVGKIAALFKKILYCFFQKATTPAQERQLPQTTPEPTFTPTTPPTIAHKVDDAIPHIPSPTTSSIPLFPSNVEQIPPTEIEQTPLPNPDIPSFPSNVEQIPPTKIEQTPPPVQQPINTPPVIRIEEKSTPQEQNPLPQNSLNDIVRKHEQNEKRHTVLFDLQGLLESPQNNNAGVAEVLNKINLAIENGVNLNTLLPTRSLTSNETLLHSACCCGVDPQVIKHFLDKGADPNIPALNNETPLHRACSRGVEVEGITHLLQNKADPNAKTDKGVTPLHQAHQRNVAEVLVQHGAKIDYSHLATHLSYFLKHGSLYASREEVANYLIEQGVDLKECPQKTKDELLKFALKRAVGEPFHTFFYENYSYVCLDDHKCKDKFLDLANKLLSWGATFKDPDGVILAISIRCEIDLIDNGAPSSTQAEQRKITERLLELGSTDPKGFLLYKLFKQAIEDVRSYHNLAGSFLPLIHLLRDKGAVSLEVADPQGELMASILRDAFNQSPDNSPDSLNPWFKVVDELIASGAKFENDNIYSNFVLKALEKARNCWGNEKQRTYYLKLAQNLKTRGASLPAEKADAIIQNLKMNGLAQQSCSSFAKTLVDFGLPDATLFNNKTLAEWIAEGAFIVS